MVKMRKILALLLALLTLGVLPLMSWGDGIETQAKSLILVEDSTGKVLYELNADESLPPASVTKIMTLLLVFEAIEEGKLRFEQLYDQENKVTVGERIVTSNISEKFVEGLFIGYVSEIQQDPNNLTKTGTIVTPVDFGHLKDVFVITVNKQDAIDKTEDASNEK